ncbi:MAG TPA: (d)CMP kinase [Rhizomicrobium sp.]|nr:(d)CMP kinase [Rhizomicrobium sp.]
MTCPIVIAVDGTAASGKGTLARRLAAHFHFAHLDSGSLYRLTALRILRAHGDLRDEAAAVASARSVDPADAGRYDLRGREIAEGASVVAAIPGVRAELLAWQQRFARNPGAAGAVIDGRDIGTVICPDATAKLFVDAAPELRARRRRLELEAAGEPASEAAILAEIRARDARDRNRAVAPLLRAPDAALLDTSDLDIDAAFAAALALVEPRIEEALAARQRG